MTSIDQRVKDKFKIPRKDNMPHVDPVSFLSRGISQVDKHKADLKKRSTGGLYIEGGSPSSNVKNYDFNNQILERG